MKVARIECAEQPRSSPISAALFARHTIDRIGVHVPTFLVALAVIHRKVSVPAHKSALPIRITTSNLPEKTHVSAFRPFSGASLVNFEHFPKRA
jgi:hypothetical protein